MQILVKKFTLRRNGIEYKAGSVVELPDAEGTALVAGAPLEFEEVTFAETEEAPDVPDVPDVPVVLEKPLDDYTTAELKVMCAEQGIAFPDKANKQKLIDLLLAEDTGEVELPGIDEAATVK